MINIPEKLKFISQNPDGSLAAQDYIHQFNKWYNEVFAYAQEIWVCDVAGIRSAHFSRPSHATHKGIIFGIKPLREDTAEDVLRKLIETIEDSNIVEYKGTVAPSRISLKEAKAFLEKKK